MKKLLSSLLLSIFLFTSFAFAGTFEDIPNDSPYFYAIDYLRRAGVFKETKNFNPDLVITKAEFIKYLVLLNNRDYKEKTDVKLPFKDTQDNAWYASYFDSAIDLGILYGWEENIYPYNKLTLIEAVELLFHSQSIPIPKVYVGGNPYKDLQANEKYTPMIMRALQLRVIEPIRDDSVGIFRRITRAEAAKMIYRMDLVNLSTSIQDVTIESYDIELQKIISVWDIIYSGFIDRDKLNKAEISDAAIEAIVDQLDDPYSAYLDQEENSAFSDDLDGEIEGIGAYIGVNDNEEIVIIAPMEDSPAERAGIKAGDIIRKVDETDIKGLGLYETVNLIKGPKGTSVKLTIERIGSTKIIDVVRDVIEIKALQYDVIENGKIMYTKLSSFNQNAPVEFTEVVDIISGSNEIKGFILDLRDDPGGLLDAAVRILGHFLRPDSEVVTIKYNYFEYTQYANGPSELAGFPIVVIINNGSASASEIVAGAIQDYGLGVIIGDQSFGKGTVQEINYFIDNSSLKLTIAKWLTPLGNDIQENGITPDIKIADNPNTEKDEQLERAIIEINKLIR